MNKWNRYETYPQGNKLASGSFANNEEYLAMIKADGQEAKKLMEETGVAHVLYGIKRKKLLLDGFILDRYMQPMDEETFLKYFGSQKQVEVLCVHNPKYGLPEDADTETVQEEEKQTVEEKTEPFFEIGNNDSLNDNEERIPLDKVATDAVLEIYEETKAEKAKKSKSEKTKTEE